MGRKQGDNNFANYVSYQAFSSDAPTLRVNFTNWFLKSTISFSLNDIFDNLNSALLISFDGKINSNIKTLL